jgi:hypothetical protein
MRRCLNVAEVIDFKNGLLISCVTALALLTGVSYAADKITLTCSGTVWVKGFTKEGQAPNPSFVIDLDEGIVTSSLGEFSIIELTPSRIRS